MEKSAERSSKNWQIASIEKSSFVKTPQKRRKRPSTTNLTNSTFECKSAKTEKVRKDRMHL